MKHYVDYIKAKERGLIKTVACSCSIDNTIPTTLNMKSVRISFNVQKLIQFLNNLINNLDIIS